LIQYFTNVFKRREFFVLNDKKYEGKDYIELEEVCNQFVMIEAKMYSDYSSSITNANYNQVARNIACMCNLVGAKQIEKLAFYTFLPDSQKDYKRFYKWNLNDKNENYRKNIMDNVNKRIEVYNENGRIDEYDIHNRWLENELNHFLDKITIKIITWEDILKIISDANDNETFEKLNSFYNKIIKMENF